MSSRDRNGDRLSSDGNDLSRVYQALEQPGSPPRLDDTIRAAARQSLTGSESQTAPGRQRQWYRVAGFAAVVILSATLVILVPRYEEPAPAPAARVPEAPAESAVIRALDAKKEKSDSRLDQPQLEEVERLRDRTAERDEARRANELELKQMIVPGSKLSRESDRQRALEPLASPPALNLSPSSLPAGRSQSLIEPDTASGAGDTDALQEDAGFDYRAAPELWIAHIEHLLGEGRFEDAEREFQAFQDAFPQHEYARSR